MKKCPYCQEFIQDDAVKCRFCGSMLTTPPPTNPGMGNRDYYTNNNAFDCGASGKSRGIAALLAILFGGLGIQYFYLGKNTAGLLSILLSIVTCGIWSFIALVQGILMFCMDNATFEQKYVNSPSTFPVF